MVCKLNCDLSRTRKKKREGVDNIGRERLVVKCGW